MLHEFLPYHTVAFVRLATSFENAPDVGGFPAKADRNTFIKAANYIDQIIVKLNSFFWWITELTI